MITSRLLSRGLRSSAARWAAVFLVALVVAGLAATAAAEPPETSPRANRTPLRAHLPDPLAARPLNPNFDLFPDSSLADFSYLLDAPAGKRGFVTESAEGQFQYGDGTRARFWGVVVTQEHIDIPTARIDEVVDVLARAGCNMVRFHSLDNRAGYEFGFIRRTIIDDAPPHDSDTQHFDPEYRDRLDYWVAKLKERGIYSFLVLRAFRHYKDGDRVEAAGQLPRGARPMAFFNERLIELQVQFAHDLLFGEKNPYTGLALGEDPAVALIELFNEDSLFSRPGLWHSMPEPYQGEFQQLWTDYLVRSYKTTENLRVAWTDDQGVCALGEGENLEAGTVALPDMNTETLFVAGQAEPYADAQKSPARRRDGVRFAVELQRAYFEQMDASLRDMGVKVPMTGVVAGGIVPDTFSVAQELGFTAENMYQEHPSFEPGREWLPPFYYGNQNPLKSDSVHHGQPFIARYRWSRKPLSVREWATSWPNEYRACSMMEMAAYSRLQDYDAMLYFAYYTSGDFTRLGPFVLGNDPVRWGMFGPAAALFLDERTVSPARLLVEIGHDAEDLSTLGSWAEPVYQLSWVHRIANTLRTEDLEPAGDLLILGGRSHATGYKGGRALIYSNGSHVTASHRVKAEGGETVWAKSGYNLDMREPGGVPLKFDGTGFDDGYTTSLAGASFFTAESLRKARLHPVGEAADGSGAMGGYHELRKNLVLGKLPPALVPRFAVDMARHLYETPMTHKDLDAGLWLADTGEIVRDTRAGRLFVQSPMAAVVQGQLTTGSAVSLPGGALEVNSLSPIASVVALPLDGKPLLESDYFLVKMVTVAENRKQLLEPAAHPAMQGKFVMTTEGGSPIVTHGRPRSDDWTVVSIGGEEIVAAGLENGVWELLVDAKARRAYLHCDTPNAAFRVALPRGNPVAQFTMTRFQNEVRDGTPPMETAAQFVYPGWAKYIELRY